METLENTTPLKRPAELECDVVRFQNQKDKWIAFVGLKDGKVYDIDLQEGLAMKKPFYDRRYDIFYDTAY